MTTPPFELGTLGLERDAFKRSDGKSWRGPCPWCGGERRFVIWTEHPFPKWNYACDHCGAKGFADQLNAAVKVELTPEQKRAFAEQRAREQASAEQLRREKLAAFSTAELQAELIDRMTDKHRAWWETQGITAEWQRYLRIGYTPDKVYRGQDGALHHTSAYTIPYYHTGWEFVTLQYRLTEAPNPADRYRFEQGLGTTFYMTQPDDAIGEQVIICEGAKKAIVTAEYGPDGYTVLAVPSKSDFGRVAEAVRECGRVYVLLDPDAAVRARKLAGDIGPQARVVTFPLKIDDAIVQHGLTAVDLLAYLRQAK